MKARRHRIEWNEDELVELPDPWVQVRLDQNEYQTPLRKACTRCYLERGSPRVPRRRRAACGFTDRGRVARPRILHNLY